MDVRILPAGDSAWLVELPERIDVAVNERAIQIARAIENAAIEPPRARGRGRGRRRSPSQRSENPGPDTLPVTDVVVGYRSVMVFFDPLARGASGIESRLRVIASAQPSGTPAAGNLVEVPVCYDGVYGPDLGHLAAFGGCSPEEAIALHLGRDYRVFMVGFVPGFAYMAPVDPRIAAPRRSSPRLKVPAGSVAVAAGQTGVYPAETPGGWSLIGRCPVKPYDPDRPEPFLFRPGDRVRFHRISEMDYRARTQWGDA